VAVSVLLVSVISDDFSVACHCKFWRVQCFLSMWVRTDSALLVTVRSAGFSATSKCKLRRFSVTCHCKFRRFKCYSQCEFWRFLRYLSLYVLAVAVLPVTVTSDGFSVTIYCMIWLFQHYFSPQVLMVSVLLITVSSDGFSVTCNCMFWRLRCYLSL
jgi:hypothetical protein